MEPGPERISEILSRLFTSRGWGRTQERSRLEQAWIDAAGPDISRQTRVAALKRGVLEVVVGNSALMQELAGFHKRKLLEAVKKTLTGMTVKDLKFRAGVVKS